MANKNECGKTRPKDNPYEVWRNDRFGYEYLILKKYQAPDKENNNPFARWFCATKSPHTYGSYELGDGYVANIIDGSIRVDNFAEGENLRAARKANGMPNDPLAGIL